MKKILLTFLCFFSSYMYSQDIDCETAYRQSYRLGFYSVAKVYPTKVPLNPNWNLNLQETCREYGDRMANSRGKSDGRVYLEELRYKNDTINIAKNIAKKN